MKLTLEKRKDKENWVVPYETSKQSTRLEVKQLGGFKVKIVEEEKVVKGHEWPKNKDEIDVKASENNKIIGIRILQK